MTILSKVLEMKVFEILSLNLQCQLICYLLGVEMNLGYAHKTRFWYFLRVFLIEIF